MLPAARTGPLARAPKLAPMQVAPAQLPAHLAKGLRSLYTVHGDEPLLVQEAADAIRAAARAAGPTERWLLFLHPSPGSDDPLPDVERPVSVLDAVGAVTGRETLLEDMAVLERHNAATRRHRAATSGSWVTMTTVWPSPCRPAKRSRMILVMVAC